LQEANSEIGQALAEGKIPSKLLPHPECELLQFAKILTLSPHKNTPENVAALRHAGWGDEQIAEAVYITALFAFFNRVADAFGLDNPSL
jgi:alkylhydroperoxidase family enzyme